MSDSGFVATDFKLDIHTIQKLIDMGHQFRLSGQSILNTIFQLEYMLGKRSEMNGTTAKMTTGDVIGCLMLSSKYFEDNYESWLKPQTIQKVFNSYSIDTICKIEIECIQRLDYSVDHLLVNRFNFWNCTDRIILDFKDHFKLSEKYYVRLCQTALDIAVKLFYKIGHGVDVYDDKSLACCIIICAFRQIQSHKSPSVEIRVYLGM